MVPFELVTNGGDGIFAALLDEFEMVDEEDEDEWASSIVSKFGLDGFLLLLVKGAPLFPSVFWLVVVFVFEAADCGFVALLLLLVAVVDLEEATSGLVAIVEDDTWVFVFFAKDSLLADAVSVFVDNFDASRFN